MSRPVPARGRGRGRGGPSLIAAAQAQGRQPSQPAQLSEHSPSPAPSVQRIHLSDSVPPATAGSYLPPNLASVPMTASTSAGISESSAPGSGGPAGSASSRSTPVAIDAPVPPPGGVQRLKFKPKVPVRRVKQEVDVKPDISTAPVRGAHRGRGRGSAPRGRGGVIPSTAIAAGLFGGARPAASGRRFAAAAAPAMRNMDLDDVEVYSDHSDDEDMGRGGMGRPIDIDMVSTMSESAPTSLYRDRRLNQGKAKGKDEKDAKVKGKGKAKAAGSSTLGSTSGTATPVPMPMEVDSSLLRVKDEPISPEKRPHALREDDAMMSDDEEQDRDERGRRVRSFARSGGNEDDEEVNEAQKVDLSESESEEEEEMMEGDFVDTDGYDDPEKKLYIFQFPHLFPKFVPRPTDLTDDTPAATTAPAAAPAAGKAVGARADEKKDVKPDLKPTPAQLRATAKKAAAEVPPEGRVGTLVVMKSGRVKMVMGKDIVMNVSPGLPATFIQHLVHLDAKQKASTILGEVHKSYVVTPDIDRLLEELYIRGGQTPGEKEAEQRRKMARMRAEGGLVKMEVD